MKRGLKFDLVYVYGNSVSVKEDSPMKRGLKCIVSQPAKGF